MNHNIKAKIFAKPVYQGAVNAFTSAAVATKDINSLGFLVNVDPTGATIDASNKLTFSFTECDTEAGTYVAAPAESAYADQAELNAAAQIGKTTVIEYRGQAAFVKLVAVETGTASGNMSVVALSLHPETMPAV
jgi:hypothetical protein